MNLKHPEFLPNQIIYEVTSQLTYRTVKRDQQKQLQRLLSNWVQYEPLTHCAKVSDEEWGKQLEIVLPENCSNGLTVVAVDNQTNEIVGTLTTIADETKINKEFEKAFSDLSTPFAQIIVFLDDLNHQSQSTIQNIFPQNGPEKTAHCWLIYVDESYKRRGIAQKLAQYAEIACKKAGFSYLKVQTTGEFSAKAFLKNGWKCVGSKNPADYIFEGKQIFKDIDCIHQTTRLLMKKIS